MKEIGKYAKVVILSTLSEKKTLADISKTWFKNRARLYVPKILAEIKEAQKQNILIQEDKFYHVNINKLIEYLFKNNSLGEKIKLFDEYKKNIIKFYNNLDEYSKKTYLDFEIIKTFFLHSFFSCMTSSWQFAKDNAT